MLNITMTLPDKIFITGAPGSKWTSVTHLLETTPGANTSDRTSERHYDHNVFQGHHGAYFALPHRNYEFDVSTDNSYINSAYSCPDTPGKFVKGHDWAYVLDDLAEKQKGNWLIIVQRNDLDCYTWWNHHGGFKVEYPSYETYFPDAVMMGEIMKLNDIYSRFAQKRDARWEYFSPRWVKENFGHQLTADDMLVLNNRTIDNFNEMFCKVLVCLIKL